MIHERDSFLVNQSVTHAMDRGLPCLALLKKGSAWNSFSPILRTLQVSLRFAAMVIEEASRKMNHNADVRTKGLGIDGSKG